MSEMAKKRKRSGTISEEDISVLFQRYSANTVLALLQEVAQWPGKRIDWDLLVRKTATGISSAREYQMVWRYLAYRHLLEEKIDVAVQPLEDDSDLEYELDAYPSVTAEAAAEAVACVKVLTGSGLPSELNMVNGSMVEAPLTINIPTLQSSKAGLGNGLPSTSNQGTNITVPVSIPKESHAGTFEGVEMNGTVNNSQAFQKKKRKPWTEEEDLELMAAVVRCGEGNWANIVKGDFKGNRTASQLSQRWSTLRKKQERDGTNVKGSRVEQQLATRRAIDMALKDNSLIPPSGNSKPNSAVGNGAAATSNPVTVSASKEDLPVVKKDPPPQQQSQKQLPVPSASKATVSAPPLMSRPTTKKAVASPTIGPDSMVKAAAVAAGARIASASEADIIKKAQSLQVVHVVKQPATSTANLKPAVALPSFPNVKIFRSNAVPSTTSPSAPVQANVSKPAVASVALPQSVKPPPAATTATATPSPLAAGNHHVEGNSHKLAPPSVVLPQSVKPAPAVTTTPVSSRPVHQPVKPAPAVTTTAASSRPVHQPVKPAATSAIVRPVIPSSATVTATSSPSNEQAKLPTKVSGLLHTPVRVAGNVKMPTIPPVQAPAAACNPPTQPQGKQALKDAEPRQFPSSSTRLNIVVQKGVASIQKLNPDQRAPIQKPIPDQRAPVLAKMEAVVVDKPAAGPQSTKGIEVAHRENNHKVSCDAVHNKEKNGKDGKAVGGHHEESMTEKPKVFPSLTGNANVGKSAGVEGSAACS